MSPFSEVRLVCLREVTKNLRGPKGLVLSLLSLAGGALLALLMNYQTPTDAGIDPAAVRAMHEKMLLQMYEDADLARSMAEAPVALTGVLGVCIWLAPALVWLAGFDAISGEIQHRTVRYWAGRTRRSSYYAGKVLGLFATVAAITLAMHTLIWTVTIVRGGGSFAATLSWGLRFYLTTLPIMAAWCGIAALVGSLFRSPLSSLLTVGFAFFALFLLGALVPQIIRAATHDMDHATARALAYCYPNGYDRWLLSPTGSRLGVGLLACLGFVVVTSAAGAALHARRDV